MLNILSCVPGQKIKGKDIKEWIRYHTENETSHTKEASKMKNYLTIDDDALYTVNRGRCIESGRKFCVNKVRKETAPKHAKVMA